MNSQGEVEKYITRRNMNYLAVEDKVVWFESLTGKPLDAKWFDMSIKALTRLLNTTKFSNKVEEEIVLWAFQDTERVFEFGVHGLDDVREGVFSYNAHMGFIKDERVFYVALKELSNVEHSWAYHDLKELIETVAKKMKTSLEMRYSFPAYLRATNGQFNGMTYRYGNNRASVLGTTTTCWCRIGKAGGDVRPPTTQERKMLVSEITSKL